MCYGGVFSSYTFCHLSPILPDVVKTIRKTNNDCYISGICTCIFLHANDIILMVLSVDSLHRLLVVCEDELIVLDMRMNVNKSVCITFGSSIIAKLRICQCNLTTGDQLK